MASSLSPEQRQDQNDGNNDLGQGNNAQSTSHSAFSRNDEMEGSQVQVRKLFVGNLSFWVSYKEISKFFTRFGSVQNAHVAKKKDGTRERFGFVTFFDPDAAERALVASREEGLRFKGQNLVINKAASKHQPKVLENGKIMWTNKRRNVPYSNGFTSRTGSDWSSRHRPAHSALPMCNTNDLIDESQCVVHLLNDDCLMYIFSYLSKVERIKIERVCKRWQALSLHTWLPIKELNFNWLSEFSQRKNKYRYLNTNILGHVLSRCGSNLRSLDLSYKYTKLRERSLETVAQECPNLSCLTLSNFCLSVTGIMFLKPIGPSLRRVVLENTGNTKEAHLATFFQQCPNLTSVVLLSNTHLSGECLRSLNAESLQELVLDSCNGLRAHILAEVFAPFKNLERLSMSSCISVTSCVLDNVFKSIPQLRSLSLCMHFPLLKANSLLAVAHLTNLVTLILAHNAYVNDEVVKAIAKNCKKIEVLDITGCSVHTMDNMTLTDTGMVYVAQLPKLTHLKMSYMAALSDRSLVSVAEPGKLQTLECRGSPTFTDFGICRLIELCSELELLDFSGCNFVSDKTVTSAIDAVRLRTNGVKLKMITGASAVWMKDVKEPMLEVDTSDLSVPCHRPDYVDDVYFFSDSDDDFDDGIDQFDWECQSMFLGDDIGELIFANQFLPDSDEDSDDFDNGLYFF